jgi:hypothetical protein
MQEKSPPGPAVVPQRPSGRLSSSEVRASARCAARLLISAGLLFPALVTQACGSDSGADRALDREGNKANAGGGGTTSSHIDPAAAGKGSSAARGGTGGSGTPEGNHGGLAGAGGERPDPPGATDDGLSPYSVPCDDTTACGDPSSVTCLHVLLDEGTRYTCSNDCGTTADCSDAPSGTDAAARCVQFTSAKHCVLVCYDGAVESDCPDGMGCYRYLDSPIGYCLSL